MLVAWIQCLQMQHLILSCKSCMAINFKLFVFVILWYTAVYIYIIKLFLLHIIIYCILFIVCLWRVFVVSVSVTNSFLIDIYLYSSKASVPVSVTVVDVILLSAVSILSCVNHDRCVCQCHICQCHFTMSLSQCCLIISRDVSVTVLSVSVILVTALMSHYL